MTLVEDKTETLETYSKEILIGKGSYAKVYLGKDSNDRSVALKEFRKGGKLNSRLTKSAKKEIGIISKCEHKNIVKYIDDYTENGHRILVLEYAEYHLGRVPAFRTDFVLNYMKNLVAGIDYLHNVREIIHMDLKPENILIFPDETMTDELETIIDEIYMKYAEVENEAEEAEEDEAEDEDADAEDEDEDDVLDEIEDKTAEYQYRNATVKICDFSISVSRSKQNLADGCCCGTLWYRAPECLYNPFEGSVTPAVDIWALGCILYEMCANRPLFSGMDEETLISLIREFDLTKEKYTEVVRKVDKTLGDLFERMLEVDPKKRITIKQLAKELGI